jgi:NADH dehydrogenase/NADH:ubiquinone oxidoreductase subunit G
MDMKEAFDLLFGTPNGRGFLRENIAAEQADISSMFKDYVKDNGYESKDEVAGLKSAFEKTKEELKAKKEEIAKMVEDHEQQLAKSDNEALADLRKQLDESQKRLEESRYTYENAKKEVMSDLLPQIEEKEEVIKNLKDKETKRAILSETDAVLQSLNITDPDFRDLLCAKYTHNMIVEETDGSERVKVWDEKFKSNVPVEDFFSTLAQSGKLDKMISEKKSTATKIGSAGNGSEKSMNILDYAYKR